MTGMEIVEYLVSKNKLDEEFFTNGKIPGYLTLDEYALKCGVGTETVRVLCVYGYIPSVSFEDGDRYVPENTPYPNKKGEKSEKKYIPYSGPDDRSYFDAIAGAK